MIDDPLYCNCKQSRWHNGYCVNCGGEKIEIFFHTLVNLMLPTNKKVEQEADKLLAEWERGRNKYRL